MLQPMQFILIGKFSHGHPNMEISVRSSQNLAQKELSPWAIWIRSTWWFECNLKKISNESGLERYDILMDSLWERLHGVQISNWRPNPPSFLYGSLFQTFLCSSSTNKPFSPLALLRENHSQWTQWRLISPALMLLGFVWKSIYSK